MEKKQTAVEWLIEQIEAKKVEIVYSDEVHSIKCLPSIVSQAIEMEKEQMEASYSEGLKRMSYIRSMVDGIMIPDENPVPDDFDTFYKNKYGQP